MPSRVSVVIVNWNAGDCLLESVASVLAAAGAGCDAPEIIVVDNASSDGSLDLLHARFPGVRLIENRENLGFARASNQGIRASGGDYVLLLNPDAMLRPGALQTLTRCLDARPEAAACGPTILDGRGVPVPIPTRPRLARMLFADTLAAKVFPARRAALRELPTVETPVQTLSGCCLLLRRRALDAAGLLCERLFLYYEESELLERLRRQGWTAYFVPAAEAVHLGEQSTARLPTGEKLLIDKRSALELWRSRYGPARAAALRWIQLLLVALTLLGVAVRLPCRRSPAERRKLTFYCAFLRLLLHGEMRAPGEAAGLGRPDGLP